MESREIPLEISTQDKRNSMLEVTVSDGIISSKTLIDLVDNQTFLLNVYPDGIVLKRDALSPDIDVNPTYWTRIKGHWTNVKRKVNGLLRA
jgi:hypothetical protein